MVIARSFEKDESDAAIPVFTKAMLFTTEPGGGRLQSGESTVAIRVIRAASHRAHREH